MSDEVVASLREPSELREGDALKILEHLYERQTQIQSKPAFQFSHYLDKDGTLTEAHPRRLVIATKDRAQSTCINTKKNAKKQVRKKPANRKSTKGKEKAVSPPLDESSDSSDADFELSDAESDTCSSSSEDDTSSDCELSESESSEPHGHFKNKTEAKIVRSPSPNFSDIGDHSNIQDLSAPIPCSGNQLRLPEDMCVYPSEPPYLDIHEAHGDKYDIQSESRHFGTDVVNSNVPTLSITGQLDKYAPDLTQNVQAMLQGHCPTPGANVGSGVSTSPVHPSIQRSMRFLAFSKSPNRQHEARTSNRVPDFPSKAVNEIQYSPTTSRAPQLATPPSTQHVSADMEHAPTRVANLDISGPSGSKRKSSELGKTGTTQKRRRRDPTPVQELPPKRQRKETWRQAMSYLKPNSHKTTD